MNPLYQMMMNKQPQGNDILSRFRQFQQNFRGNPRQQVEELLRSGRISQTQYDDAVRMANQFRNMM